MNSAKYFTKDLELLLLDKKVCTLQEMKDALGTNVNMTVFRKLKQSITTGKAGGLIGPIGAYYTHSYKELLVISGQVSFV